MKPLVFDVGADIGNTGLYWYNNGDCRVIAFEPKRDTFFQLLERTNNLPNYELVNKAVSILNGVAKFNVCKGGGASSLLEIKSDEELRKHWGNRQDIQYSGVSYLVETTTLSRFIEQRGLQNTPIAFLNVNAQGMDLEILKSLGPYIKNVESGCMFAASNSDRAVYRNQTSIVDDCRKWLADNGFSVVSTWRNDCSNNERVIVFRRN